MSVTSVARRWGMAVGVAGLMIAGRGSALADVEPGPNIEYRAPLHFTNDQDRFSILLPEGWTQMPSVLAEGLANAEGTAAQGKVGAYGFELSSKTNTMAAPCVTVQVMRVGRIADGFLLMLRNPEIRRRAVADMLKKDGLSEGAISNLTFDTNRYQLRFCATRTDEDGNQLRVWQAITFTERGSINITCLSGEAPGENWDQTFNRVIDSLALHSALEYRPNSMSNHAEGTKFRATGVLFVPGIMVVLGIGRLISRRFGDQVMSDEI